MAQYTNHHIRQWLGHHVHCHTQYGNITGIVVHYTKHHVFLLPIHVQRDVENASWEIPVDHRPLPMGPVGPSGPRPGYGPAWHLAIPVAAILGITALSMHAW